MTTILNCRFTSFITFHIVLHGFREDRGTDTAPIEAKLTQQLTAMREEVLYSTFMDLRKAYDALERDRCLEILEGCGVGPRDLHILRAYWDRPRMVDYTRVYYGAAFQDLGGRQPRGNRCTPPFSIWWRT